MSQSEQRTGVVPKPLATVEMGFDDEEPPGPPRRHPLWQNIPDKQWDDWRWQSQNAIRSVRQLRDLLPFHRTSWKPSARSKPSTSSPSRRTTSRSSIPTTPTTRSACSRSPRPLEADNPSGYELEDPLEEDRDTPVPGLTHRYPDRALMLTTHVCTMYCRFCTRKRATMVRGGWDAISRDDERMIEYVRDHPRDPRRHRLRRRSADAAARPSCKFFLDNLAAIPHVDVIRIGTRVPVTLPQKLYDQELIDLLAVGREGLDPDALQPPARDHARGGPRLQDACSGPACRSTTTPCC